MSTYLYLMCMDHTPPLKAWGESGQHTYDLPQIRADIANRESVVEAWEVSHGFDEHFRHNTGTFLRDHPTCTIGIRDEYGDWYSITSDDEPRCGSSVTLRDEEHRLCRCHLPDRHGGYHDSGDGVTWPMNCPHCDAPAEKSGHSLRKPHCPGRPGCNWVRCTVCASYWGTGRAHHCGTNDCQAEKEK